MDDKLTRMKSLAERISVCTACQLHLSRKKSVPGEGNIETRIMLIGEGPGMNENESGRPFVGQAGNFLNELLNAAKLKRSEVFITNVVKCRPPANRDPLPEELQTCNQYLEAQIELINPLIIVTLGRYSMGRFFPLQRISSIHGQARWIDGRMIVPMFHPAAALHQPNLREIIIRDFAKLPLYLDEAATVFQSAAAESEIQEEEPTASPAAGKKDGVQLSFF